MAAPQTTVRGGFVIDASRADEPEADDAPLTEEQELLVTISTRLRQGFSKAAYEAAQQLVRTIRITHGL